MNYQRLYDLFIERAKIRAVPNNYTESHHIIPKELGGPDDAWNLVELTAREHLFAHIVLHKITPENQSLLKPLTFLTTRANRKLPNWLRLKTTSALAEGCRIVGSDPAYSEAKRANGIACRDAKKGFHDSEVKRKAGEIGGAIARDTGQIYELQKQVASIAGKASGKQSYLNKDRIFAIPPEERSKISRKTALSNLEKRVGIFSFTPEEKSEVGRKGAAAAKEKGVGIFGITSEARSATATKVCLTKYKCEECGYENNPGNIGVHQRKTGHKGKYRVA